MRILIILAQYYPALNPNVDRWSAISEYWTQEGHEVHILCTKRQGRANEEQIRGVWVHRAGQNSLLDWVYNLFRWKERRGEQGAVIAKKQSWIQRLLEKIMDYTWRKIYWPDGTCLWYLSGKRKALLLHNKHNFDALISVSIPFTANLIAAALKKRIPSLCWLMDIEDPFAVAASLYINNTLFYDHLNYKIEQKLLRRATKISVTVENAAKLYLQKFKDIKKKIYIIPPLFSLPTVNNFFEVPPGKIHIAYFGNFYPPIRTPVAFLFLLRQTIHHNEFLKANLIIHFFGTIHPFIQLIFEKHHDLNENLRFYGLVSREAVAAAMPAMDFLVNIGNTTDYHLPSKASDYLMSAKPIINICYNSNDPFKIFFSNYPFILNLLAVNNQFSADQIQEFSLFLQKNKGKQVASELVQELGAPYQIKKIAEDYLRLLQS